MGDRGNIAIKQYASDDRVYLYSHWGGTELPRDLQRALAKRWRWDDDAYLARIIFDVMTEGQHDQETGYGIATYQQDNEHPILVVDCEKKEVSISGGRKSWTFEEFVALKDPIAEVNGD